MAEDHSRRKYFRVQTQSTIEVKNESTGHLTEAELVNMSRGGFGLTSDTSFKFGDNLTLSFYLSDEDRTVTVNATVKHCTKNPSLVGLYFLVGLEFPECKSELLEAIERNVRVDRDSDEQVLKRYRLARKKLLLHRVQTFSLVGIPLWFSFLTLDYVVYPEHFKEFLILRTLAASWTAIIWIFTYFRRVQKLSEILAYISFGVPALAVVVMIGISDGIHSHYYAGVNIVVLAILLMNSLTPVLFLFFGLFILGCYAVAVHLNPEPVNYITLFSASMYMLGTVVFSCTLAKLYSSQFKNEFQGLENIRRNRNKLTAAYQAMKTQAETDELTQVYNRRAFLHLLSQRIEFAQKENSCFYLILLDLDKFKEINDIYGHLIGDRALQAMVKTLLDQMRFHSYIGRYGGDEFLLLMDRATHEEIRVRLQGICAAIQQTSIESDGKKISLSASFGAVEYDPSKQLSTKSLLDLADSALRHVKGTGRGNIHIL